MIAIGHLVVAALKSLLRGYFRRSQSQSSASMGTILTLRI
jgi:hypothetical protein